MTVLIGNFILGFGCVDVCSLGSWPYNITRSRNPPPARPPTVSDRRHPVPERLPTPLPYTTLYVTPLTYALPNQPNSARYTFHPTQAWIATMVLTGAIALLYR